MVNKGNVLLPAAKSNRLKPPFVMVSCSCSIGQVDSNPVRSNMQSSRVSHLIIFQGHFAAIIYYLGPKLLTYLGTFVSRQI